MPDMRDRAGGKLHTCKCWFGPLVLLTTQACTTQSERNTNSRSCQRQRFRASESAICTAVGKLWETRAQRTVYIKHSGNPEKPRVIAISVFWRHFSAGTGGRHGILESSALLGLGRRSRTLQNAVFAWPVGRHCRKRVSAGQQAVAGVKSLMGRSVSHT